MNIVSPGPLRTRPKVWEDDGWFVPGRPLMPDVEVFEEDEILVTRSQLVQPNGDPIFYVRPSTKLGFIGFVKPSWADEDECPDDETPDDQEDDRS